MYSVQKYLRSTIQNIYYEHEKVYRAVYREYILNLIFNLIKINAIKSSKNYNAHIVHSIFMDVRNKRK